jgi:hypothetical protein
VQAADERLFQRDFDDPTIVGGERLTLLICSSCHVRLLGRQKLHIYEGATSEDLKEWSAAIRVWPEPRPEFHFSIPTDVTASLEEARKSLHCGAYTASVAMTGRALEAIGRHFHTQGNADQLMLGKGLEELHTARVLDDRLYEWGKELHEHRNMAAHASGASFSKVDAEDLYDFATAICEYVFVLAGKYAAFMRRKAYKKSIPKLPKPPDARRPPSR